MKKIFNTTPCLSQEEIRQYLAKDLPEDRRYELENHMLDCPLCHDAVEGFAAHYNFEGDSQLSEIEETIQLREQAAPEAKARPIRRLLLNRIAASLLFLILATSAILYWQSGHQERLYQAYYESPDTDLFAGLRSGSASSDTEGALDQAMNFYKQKAFEQSLPHFEEYFAQSPENATANFLAGTAYLEVNRLASAEEHFHISRINSGVFYEQATWYLALIHIRVGNKEEATVFLNELVKGSQKSYRDKARTLLKEL